MERKMFIFKRGTEYAVTVIVANNDSMTFCNIIYPDNTPEDVIEQLLNDAETATLKQLEGEYEAKYYE